jgi:TPR repeat protein
MRYAAFALMLLPTIGSAQNLEAGFVAYWNGDYATALREWRLAAEQGDATAQFKLGQMYDVGQGVPQDHNEAVKWYWLSAEQGYAGAQSSLGVMYSMRGDDAEAVKWWRLAAEQGDAWAQVLLGARYLYGEGVPQDDVTAHMWASIADINGLADAARLRDEAAANMMPADISEAQRRTEVCMWSDYQDCD